MESNRKREQKRLTIVIAWTPVASRSESHATTISLSTFLFLYFLSVTDISCVENYIA